MLDKRHAGWYYNRARVGDLCACNAMMQEIAPKGGNFCGVCPVIGRLNASFALAYIARLEEWSALVGQFSCPEMIRTEARTEEFDRTQPSHN